MAAFQTLGIVLASFLAVSVEQESLTNTVAVRTTTGDLTNKPKSISAVHMATATFILSSSRDFTVSTTANIIFSGTTTTSSVTIPTTTAEPTTTPEIVSPTLGEVIQGETTLKIEWSGSINSFFMVRHAVTGQDLRNSISSRTMETTVTITNLTPGESYDIQIIAYRTETGGEGIPGSVYTFTTRPSMPTGVQGEAIGRAVRLAWSYTEGHIVDNFTLKCIPTIGDCRGDDPITIGNSTARVLTLTDTTFGITYEFRLKAVSNSITSTKVSVEVTPDGPRDLKVNSEVGRNVSLSWADLKEDVDYYRVYWNALEAGAGDSYSDTGGNMTSTTLTTLEPGYSYQLSVVSIDLTGYTTASSNLIKYTAIPDQVTGLKLQYKTEFSLSFTWSFTGRYDDFDVGLSPGDHRDQEPLIGNNGVYTLTFNNLLVDTEYTLRVRTKVEDAANYSAYKFSEYTTIAGRTDEPGTTNKWRSAAFALISVVAVLICLLAVLFVKYQRIKQTDGNNYEGAFNPQAVTEYDEVSDALELRPRIQSQVYMTAIDNCKRADPTYETPQAIPDVHTYDVVNLS